MPHLSRDELYSFRELWRRYRICRRNKRRSRNALAFEVDAEAKLLELRDELKSHRYRPGTSICFITDGPKPREVFAADFRDRIVHHLLVSRYEPVFERRFIHDSYACRKGKGTLAASDALMRMLRKVTANGRRQAFALRLDVASFFPSIDKRVLYRILRRAVRDPELRWLTRVVLFHDPTADYRFNNVRPRRPGGYRLVPQARSPRPGPTSERYPVPAQKSLFGKQNRRGLPIGNLTSQFWANVYLNELDRFVKRSLRCRHYLRYVDDLCLLSENPRQLECWLEQIGRFLAERLHLSLRAELAEPRSVGRGVDWVGWRTWWDRRLPRRRTLANLRVRLGAWERDHVVRRAATTRRPATQEVDLFAAHRSGADEVLRATLASYSGHLRHGRAHRDWEREWAARPWLDGLFERAGWALRERWSARSVAGAGSFTRQIAALTARAGGGTLVFCRVGRYVELRGQQRLLAERVLGLRAVRLPRGGFAFVAGFRATLGPIYRARALRRGLAVVDVHEMRAGRGDRVARAAGRLSVPLPG